MKNTRLESDVLASESIFLGRRWQTEQKINFYTKIYNLQNF